MKYSFFIMLSFLSLIFCSSSSCTRENVNNSIEKSHPMTNGKIKITVNSQSFTVTLLDHHSAKAFKEILPLTMNMTELNGNEKYGDLPKSIPTNSSNPGMIKKGDLMLYGSKTLVLFYQSFSTSYHYTKLGTIENVEGLAAALGSGNVRVTFEAE